MPAESIKQQNYIFGLRKKYKSETQTPKEHKWIWKKDWNTVKLKDGIRIDGYDYEFNILNVSKNGKSYQIKNISPFQYEKIKTGRIDISKLITEGTGIMSIRKSLKPLIESIIKEDRKVFSNDKFEFRIEHSDAYGILDSLEDDIVYIVNDNLPSGFDNMIKEIKQLFNDAKLNVKVGRGGHHIWISDTKNSRMAIIEFKN